MASRAKLTLVPLENRGDSSKAETREVEGGSKGDAIAAPVDVDSKPSGASRNMLKLLTLAGFTLASLVIFKRKIF